VEEKLHVILNSELDWLEIHAVQGRKNNIKHVYASLTHTYIHIALSLSLYLCMWLSIKLRNGESWVQISARKPGILNYHVCLHPLCH
jgi:hypothetical protein